MYDTSLKVFLICSQSAKFTFFSSYTGRAMVTMPCQYPPKLLGKSFCAVASPMHLVSKRSSIFYFSASAIFHTNSKLQNLYLANFRYGESNMHIIEECFASFQATFLLPKHSTYTERMNQIIQRLHEGGLIQKWLEHEMDKVGTITKDPFSKKNNTPLSIYHIEGCLYLWLLCFLVSLLVFTLELLYAWFQYKKNQWRFRAHHLVLQAADVMIFDGIKH